MTEPSDDSDRTDLSRLPSGEYKRTCDHCGTVVCLTAAYCLKCGRATEHRDDG